MEVLPKVLPVNELKNTAKIMQICKESDKPIIITRNGYAEAVLMSTKVFEEQVAKIREAVLINESLAEIKNGAEMISGKDYFKQLKKKHGR